MTPNTICILKYGRDTKFFSKFINDILASSVKGNYLGKVLGTTFMSLILQIINEICILSSVFNKFPVVPNIVLGVPYFVLFKVISCYLSVFVVCLWRCFVLFCLKTKFFLWLSPFLYNFQFFSFPWNPYIRLDGMHYSLGRREGGNQLVSIAAGENLSSLKLNLRKNEKWAIWHVPPSGFSSGNKCSQIDR